jgi:hypothetical protein
VNTYESSGSRLTSDPVTPQRNHLRKLTLRLAPTNGILSIATDDDRIEHYVRRSYGDLLSHVPLPARTHHGVFTTCARQATITFDGNALPRPASGDSTSSWNSGAYIVDQFVWRSLAADPDWLAIYGCAVSVDGFAVLLIGPSSVGKTTLGLALQLQGALLYGDEMIVMQRARRTVSALARRLSVRESSLALLGDPVVAAIVRSTGAPSDDRSDRVYYVERGALGGVPTAKALGAIVLLRRGTGAPRVESLSAARAGLALSSYLALRPGTLDDLANLAEMVGATPAFAMTVGEPHASAAVLIGALARC